jgi:succinate-semialdehyde dehydrogenase/glutarate-semialdehyde dehydrogenase
MPATELRSLLRDPGLLETRAYLAGEWADADNGATFEVTNPARGDVICTVPDLGRAETARAIGAAQVAQKDWAARTARERATILRRWYDLMMAHQDDLATILTAEMGKPMARRSSNGSPKRASASMARPSPAISPTSG